MNLRSFALSANPQLNEILETQHASTCNGGWSDTPFQRWIKFKEAYSQRFVRDALALSKTLPHHCIDPFGGSGTTSLVCSQSGISSTSIEVNPFLADVILAKTQPTDARTLLHSFHTVTSSLKIFRAERLIAAIHEAPKTLFEPGLNGRFIFSEQVAHRILQYRSAIEQLSNRKAKRTLKILLGSVLIPSSNIVVNGKGRRYRGNWQARSVSAMNVDELFETAVMQCAADLEGRGNPRLAGVQLFKGDCRTLIKKCDTADISIFSPPYPNSFDYTDVYNLELWILGYLNSKSQNVDLRQATLRSHVQAAFPYTTITKTPTLTATLKELRAAREGLWDRRIPEMIQGYFDDLHMVLQGLNEKLVSKSLIVMAVGDSRYARVSVRTAEILREMAKDLRLQVVSVDRIRKIRASAQHGGDMDLAETRVVFRTQAKR